MNTRMLQRTHKHTHNFNSHDVQHPQPICTKGPDNNHANPKDIIKQHKQSLPEAKAGVTHLPHVAFSA